MREYNIIKFEPGIFNEGIIPESQLYNIINDNNEKAIRSETIKERNNNIYLNKKCKTKCINKKAGFFELKKELNNEYKKIKNSDNNFQKMRNRNKRKENIIIYYNFIIINLIQFLMLINISRHTICNNLDFYYSQYSKISLKIKGVGKNAILGNQKYYNFTSINYLKEVYINGNKQEAIDYIYYFNQVENFVELIWNDDINNCQYLFSKCINITEINLSNFNTSQVTNMGYMLYYCSSLTSLDLSNFNTSQVTNMGSMFSYCSSLTSLNVSNFMFSYCSSLTFLNLSNFNTSKVLDMGSMFSYCSLLTSLDLSNFNTSQVTNMMSMFSYCSSLFSLNLSNFNTFLVSNMYNIFKECSSLTSLDLSNFNTSKVLDMGSMFNNCPLLTSLNLSHFNTSQTTLMDYMFNSCSLLTLLDLSNFNTSLVRNMNYMFNNCSSLTSLDLSHFNTSQTRYMNYMFNNCSLLTSLNLSHFNTSQVIYTNYMFYNCSSLTSLNLSNFNTSEVENMSNMFNFCSNLEYINLKNFNESKLNYYNNMFSNVLENIVICINETATKEKIIPQIKNINCYTIDCSNNWKLKQKKLININKHCIESCDNSPQYKYEFNGNCYENCQGGFLYDDNFNALNKCKCELNKCLECPNVALSKNLCTKCNTNYYPKENDPLNLGEYVNCYYQLEGYYLDEGIYKKCYNTCKICNKAGNNLSHNCIKCNDDFIFGIEANNYFNCYPNCKYYYYIDNENNSICTLNSSCPNDYPLLIEDKMECIKYDIKDLKKYLLNDEKNETKKTKEEEIKFYDNVLEIFEKGFTSENYDTSNLDSGEDEIINTDKLIITFTTSQNQRNNINNNMTRINLGECETLLRNYYNIPINESIYLKKIDIIQ